MQRALVRAARRLHDGQVRHERCACSATPSEFRPLRHRRQQRCGRARSIADRGAADDPRAWTRARAASRDIMADAAYADPDQRRRRRRPATSSSTTSCWRSHGVHRPRPLRA
ncbi:MAG: hypothetical protein MZW92_62720 [Comamonadaceae bacterium]|nr:hypothetical protein [Comamonadaceae bacterium]